jgi:hypothetical protein
MEIIKPQNGGKKGRNLRGGQDWNTFAEEYFVKPFVCTLMFITAALAFGLVVVVPLEGRINDARYVERQQREAEARARDHARGRTSSGSSFYHEPGKGGRKKSKQSKKRRTVKRR